MNQVIDHFRQNRKDLISLILLLILIVAIPLTFVLAKQTQIFRSKASSNVFRVIQPQTGEVKYENSSQIETTTPTLDIEITSPLDNEGKQSDSGWVKTAYAAERDTYKIANTEVSWGYCQDNKVIASQVLGGLNFNKPTDCSNKTDEIGEKSICNVVPGTIFNGAACFGKHLPPPVIIVPSSPEQEFDFSKTNVVQIKWERIEKAKYYLFDIVEPDGTSHNQLNTSNRGINFDSFYLEKEGNSLRVKLSDGSNWKSLVKLVNGVYKVNVYAQTQVDTKTQPTTITFKIINSDGNAPPQPVQPQGGSSVSCEYLKYRRYKGADWVDPDYSKVDVKTPIELKSDLQLSLLTFDSKNQEIKIDLPRFKWEKTGGFFISSSNSQNTSWRIDGPSAIGKQFTIDYFIDGKKQDKCSVTIKVVAADTTGGPICEKLTRYSTSDESLNNKLLSGITTKVKPSETVGINNVIKNSKDGMVIEWEKNGGEFNGKSITGINWVAPDKPGDYTVKLKLDGQLQQSCSAIFTVESAASASGTKKDPPPPPATKKPKDDPKYCAGYYQRCGPNLEGTQWCEGGYTLASGACGWSDAHPSYTTGCYKTKEDADKKINKDVCNLPSSPQTPVGQAGAAPPVAIDYKSPGSLFGTKVVTLCGKDLTLDQLREELKSAGYNGLYDEVSATAAYLKTACPKSQQSCTTFPDTGDVPDDYVWVADCSAAGECLRNNSTGNDKNLCIDPEQNDPAACPKNYNDPYVNPATSNWCFGFANGNKCLMLWSKANKEKVSKGGGVPNPAMCPAGTTVGTPQQPAGNTGVGTTNPSATQNIETRAWEKASCSDGKFSGCTTVGGEICKDFGSNGRSGWSEAEYNKCKNACNAYGNTKNNAAACAVLTGQTPSGTKQLIKGRVIDSCQRTIGGAEVVITDKTTSKSSKPLIHSSDGSFQDEDIVLKNNPYQVELKLNTLDSSKYTGMDSGYQSVISNCGNQCYFIVKAKSCASLRIVQQEETKSITAEYRISQDRLDFKDKESLWQPYTQGGVRVQQTFSTPGQHFVFVQFRDQDKNIISPNSGDGIYILTVTYKPKDALQSTNNPPAVEDGACTVPAQPTGLNYDSPSKTVSWGEVTGVNVYHVRLVTPGGVQHNFDDIPRNWYTLADSEVLEPGDYSWWVDAPSSCGVGRTVSKFSVVSQQPSAQQPSARQLNQCIPEGNAEGLAPTSCSCNNIDDDTKRDYAGKCYTGTGKQEGVEGCNGGWCRGGVCATCSI